MRLLARQAKAGNDGKLGPAESLVTSQAQQVLLA